MKLSIKNNRVFIDDEEIRGFKKFLVLFFTYLTVPIIITFTLLFVLAVIGVTLGFIIPICIGAFLLSGIVFIIAKLLR